MLRRCVVARCWGHSCPLSWWERVRVRGARTTMTRRIMTVGLPGVLLALLLVGLPGPQRPAVATSDEPLRERVIQYWEARLQGDLLAAYQLHEPAFRRAVTFAAFSQGRGATPALAYEILDDRIEGDKALVKVRHQSTIKHAKLIKPVQPKWMETEEQWIRVEGVWYRKFRFPIGDPYPPFDWEALAVERQRAIDSEARR